MAIYLQKTGGLAIDAGARHRVLRNTYWLLALSLVPTVLGASVGVAYPLPFLRGGLGLVLFLVGAFGFIWAIERNKHSAAGVGLLLGFTFFMGLMLSPLLSNVLGLRNGAQLIMMAFGGTATIMAVMATIATVSKRDFTGMGQWLFMGVIVLILASLANFFFHLPALSLAISAVAVLIFSALILVDVQRILNGGETNYIAAALSIYLDLYNIFTALLNILGITSSDD